MEDPITAIKAGSDDTAGTGDDYTNLISQFLGPVRLLVHASTARPATSTTPCRRATMTGQVTGAAEWHINSDEPDVLDYDTTFKGRAQDALYEPKPYRILRPRCGLGRPRPHRAADHITINAGDNQSTTVDTTSQRSST